MRSRMQECARNSNVRAHQSDRSTPSSLPKPWDADSRWLPTTSASFVGSPVSRSRTGNADGITPQRAAGRFELRQYSHPALDHARLKPPRTTIRTSPRHSWTPRVHSWTSRVHSWTSRVHSWTPRVHSWTPRVHSWTPRVHSW